MHSRPKELIELLELVDKRMGSYSALILRTRQNMEEERLYSSVES